MKKYLLTFTGCLFVFQVVFANSKLPKNVAIGNWKAYLNLDNRMRYEYTGDYDLMNPKDSTKSVFFNRLRLNLNFSYKDIMDVFFEGLDAREWTYQTERKGQTDSFDLHQAYMELKNIFDSDISLKFGRQKLNYGKKRLLAAPTWSNKIRSFDAVVAKLRMEKLRSDLFIGNVVNYDPNNFNDGEGHEILGGIYNTYNINKDFLVDFYFISQVNKESSAKERFTIGNRFNIKPCENLEFDFEGSYQFGKTVNEDISAYAFAFYVQKKFDLKFNLTLKLELNLASGDSDLSDGKHETFVPIYQTTHAPYGIIDLIRWQNMREVALAGELNITDRLSLRPESHWYWLDKDADAWYKTNGSKLFSNTDGNINSRIGTEISLIAKYKVNNNLNLELGYARFFSGPVSELAGEGDHITFVYFQNILNF